MLLFCITFQLRAPVLGLGSLRRLCLLTLPSLPPGSPSSRLQGFHRGRWRSRTSPFRARPCFSARPGPQYPLLAVHLAGSTYVGSQGGFGCDAWYRLWPSSVSLSRVLVALCPPTLFLTSPWCWELLTQFTRVRWLPIAADQMTPKRSSWKQQTVILSHSFWGSGIQMWPN